MTHDPYQTLQTVGAFPFIGAGGGLQNPFSSPFNAMQTSAMNPAAAYNPLAANFAGPWNAQSIMPQQLATQGYATQGYPTQGLNYGNISPQQLQLASVLAAHSGQQAYGGQQPFANQQAFGNQLQNPFAAAALQQAVLNQLSNPIVAQAAAALAQQITAQQSSGQYGQSYGQPFAPQFTPQLAPQSWVGQGGIGQVNPQAHQGQFHPLQLQLAARALQTQGIAPWGGF